MGSCSSLPAGHFSDQSLLVRSSFLGLELELLVRASCMSDVCVYCHVAAGLLCPGSGVLVSPETRHCVGYVVKTDNARIPSRSTSSLPIRTLTSYASIIPSPVNGTKTTRTGLISWIRRSCQNGQWRYTSVGGCVHRARSVYAPCVASEGGVRGCCEASYPR